MLQFFATYIRKIIGAPITTNPYTATALDLVTGSAFFTRYLALSKEVRRKKTMRPCLVWCRARKLCLVSAVYILAETGLDFAKRLARSAAYSPV
jgi:hypothetical protein